MKTSTVLALALTACVLAPNAQAETGGCLKYGAAGAVAGHFAHHTIMGALGGCAAGAFARHRSRVMAEHQRTEELNQASHSGGVDGVNQYRQSAPPLPADPYEGHHNMSGPDERYIGASNNNNNDGYNRHQNDNGYDRSDNRDQGGYSDQSRGQGQGYDGSMSNQDR